MAAALLCALSTPLWAQDPSAQEDAGSDAGQPPVAEALERVFVRTSADAGTLAQQYPHLAVWLEPEDAPRVLGLMERETTAKPAGAMVILAGEGQSANDGLLENLRGRLSKAGWAAMSIGLESPSPSLQRARERLSMKPAPDPGESDDSAEPVMIDVNAQAAKDLLERHRTAINARLTAAVSWFTERDYRQVVLVGVGRGADEVRAYLAEAPPEVRRAAWVVADFGGQAPSEISVGFEGAPALPLLDLYSARERGTPARIAAFRRSGVASYQALPAPVPARPSARDAGAIANRLIGWAGGS